MEKATRRNDISSAILAGGKSSRMGRDKALLVLDGKPFIQHVAESLQEVFQSLSVISDYRQRYLFLGLPVQEDIFKNCGPLAGIHSALTHASADAVFIASCDLPFLTPGIIHYVVDSMLYSDATLLSTRNSLQPLCGVYKRHCLPTIENHLSHGQYSVLQCLAQLYTTTLSLQLNDTPHVLFNVNTPEDYDLCLKICVEKKR